MSEISSHFSLLHQWINQDQRRAVAINNDELLSWQQLFSRVCEWTKKLEPLPGKRWAVYTESSFEFLSVSLALWQLQRTVCVPSDNQSGTVQQLRSKVDGFIGDFDLPDVVVLTAGMTQERALITHHFVEISTDFIALEIYTSGSTGEPKGIQKTLAQLNHEIAMLEQQWPSQADTFVLSTVTHNHAYGMIFRLLWPFCSSRIFPDQLSEFMEELAQQALNARPFTLVSSPAHLSRLSSSVVWPAGNTCCISVFTAAAPLKREHSLEVERLLSATVHEIYGSSETGAIAWRSQQKSLENALWRAFDKVQIVAESDDAIRVHGPAFNTVSISDRVRFYKDGLFELQGRSDRIAKVEGKRISLTAIERRLIENPWVQDAKALVIQRQRDEVVCVIELTAESRELLQEVGKRSLSLQLKNFVAPHFERVVLPRRWRFVEAIPVNSQGKLPLKNLEAMFEDNRNSAENDQFGKTESIEKTARMWPVITSENVENQQAEVHCDIPNDLIYFDGHFDQSPILPGITQIHWAESIGKRLLSTIGRFTHLEVVKFHSIIQPNSSVVLALSYNQEKQKLTFKYTSEQGVHSSGRICFK